MDAIEAIMTRRSIRKYKPVDVDEVKVRVLLEAAFSAPSAGNQQPWHFIVIKERKLLEEIAEKHPYAKMLFEAPMAIAVCGQPSIERYKGRWVLDCSAATQNILLAARALELGSVWIGIYPDDQRMAILKEILNLPHEVYPHSLIAVGYPDEEKHREDRFRMDRIHYNLW